VALYVLAKDLPILCILIEFDVRRRAVDSIMYYICILKMLTSTGRLLVYESLCNVFYCVLCSL
jgi:hypothetical protein